MADSEFEEFRHSRRFLNTELPLLTAQNGSVVRPPAQLCYQLAHDITPCCEDLPSFPSFLSGSSNSDGSMTIPSLPEPAIMQQTTQKRVRRKLPDLPSVSSSRPNVCSLLSTQSLAEELALIENGGELFAGAKRSEPDGAAVGQSYKSREISPCESDVWPGSSDSGRDSTAHSPEEIRPSSAFIAGAEGSSIDTEQIASSVTEATHRGLHKFTARHADELAIDIGDPIYVTGGEADGDGCWCDGVNLRTNLRGLFPSAYVVDVNYDFDDDGHRILNEERYAGINYLGSLETALAKGDQVISSAVDKIRASGRLEGSSVHLEISDQGLRVVTDQSRIQPDDQAVALHDFFFAMKNLTYIAIHPSNVQFFGFITKHNNRSRYACHIFRTDGSSRHVTEALGRAFQRFCRNLVELAYPIHEFYME